MKILLLTQNYYPSVGGGIRYKKDFVDAMRSLGHWVDVLCVNTERSVSVEHEKGGIIYRAPLTLKSGSISFSLKFFSMYLKLANNYDLHHHNFPSPNAELSFYFMKIFRRIKPRQTVYYHADIVREKKGSYLYNTLVTKKFLKNMSVILVSNPSIIQTSEWLAPHKNICRLVPFGIDKSSHFRTSRLEYVDVEVSNRMNILFIGRLSRYKGIDVLIRSVNGLNVNLVIVGDGELKNELKQLAKNISKANITFLGFVPDEKMPTIISQSDVLVLPSIDRGEAFGYVLLEGMMFGCALISTELGTGTSWVNENGITGIVVQPGSIDELRDSIEKLSNNPKMLSEYKANSLAKYNRNFTKEVMVKRIIEELKINI